MRVCLLAAAAGVVASDSSADAESAGAVTAKRGRGAGAVLEIAEVHDPATIGIAGIPRQDHVEGLVRSTGDRDGGRAP